MKKTAVAATLAFLVFLIPSSISVSFPSDSIVIIIGEKVQDSATTPGAPLPPPTPATAKPAPIVQGVSGSVANALSRVCASNLAGRIVKYSQEAVNSARQRNRPSPSAEELMIMAGAMVMSEHQAIRGESLGVCRDSSSSLSRTSDCGAFQISMRGSSIYPGKTRNQVYNTNSNPSSPDYALSCFNPDNNVREGVHAVLSAWQAYRSNPSAYQPRSGGPPEIGYVGLIYNKGAAGAKRPSDPNNYYARFIENYNYVKNLAS